MTPTNGSSFRSPSVLPALSAALAAIGLAFTWFGVIRFAAVQFEKYGNLQMVQMSRMDQARNADSGFGKDVGTEFLQSI